MRMRVKSSKLIITDLLSCILHAAHGAWCSALHPHRIPLRAWRSVSLPWVRPSLLGSRPCGRPLLLLSVGIGSNIRLATHLPYLVHWAWRLEDTERMIKWAARVDRWTGNSIIQTVWKRFDFGDNCLSFSHGVWVDGYVLSTAHIRLCSNIPRGAVKSSIMMQLIVENPVMWQEKMRKCSPVQIVLELFGTF